MSIVFVVFVVFVAQRFAHCRGPACAGPATAPPNPTGPTLAPPIPVRLPNLNGDVVRTKERTIRAVLVVMGLLTASPALSVVNPGQLASYGLLDPQPLALPLLQHRGILQLAVGAALVWAAFRPDVRVPVAVGVIVCKASWLTLTLASPAARDAVSPVPLVFDPLSILLLVVLLVDIAGQGRWARHGDQREPARQRVD